MRNLSIGLSVTLAAALGLGEARAGELLTVGQGPRQKLVAEQFPPEYRAQYAVFEAKCSHCHPLSRPISALRNGIAPVSGSPFTSEYLRKYVIKMMRKPNSGISRDDAKQVIEFLEFASKMRQAGSPGESKGGTP